MMGRNSLSLRLRLILTALNSTQQQVTNPWHHKSNFLDDGKEQLESEGFALVVQ